MTLSVSEFFGKMVPRLWHLGVSYLARSSSGYIGPSCRTGLGSVAHGLMSEGSFLDYSNGRPGIFLSVFGASDFFEPTLLGQDSPFGGFGVIS